MNSVAPQRELRKTKAVAHICPSVRESGVSSEMERIVFTVCTRCKSTNCGDKPSTIWESETHGRGQTWGWEKVVCVVAVFHGKPPFLPCFISTPSVRSDSLSVERYWFCGHRLWDRGRSKIKLNRKVKCQASEVRPVKYIIKTRFNRRGVCQHVTTAYRQALSGLRVLPVDLKLYMCVYRWKSWHSPRKRRPTAASRVPKAVHVCRFFTVLSSREHPARPVSVPFLLSYF